MIVFDKAKVALLLNPKTGTRTVIEHFVKSQNSQDVRFLTTGHIPAKNAHSVLGDDQYKLYSFYRCPVERFMSAYNFVISEWKYIWDDYPISPETMQKAKEEISALTPIDILETIIKVERGPVIEVAQPQVAWLNDDVELLDFRDFDAEIVRFASYVGVDLGPTAFHNNKGTGKVSVDDLTSDEIARIKDYYRKDYEFFASRDIHFER